MTENTDKGKCVLYPEISTSVETPSIEVLKQWIATNIGNRKPNTRRISGYVKSMKDGTWGLGDPIMFDWFGNLLNGQHRIMAAIRAEVAVPFIVIRGLSPDSKLYIDTGMSRTAAQVIEISGNRHKNLRARLAILRAMFYGSRLKKKSVLAEKQAKSLWTDIAQGKPASFFVPLLDEYKYSLDFVLKTVGPGFLVGPVQAVVARAYYTQNHDRLREFLIAVGTGKVSNLSGDDAAISLRNVLIRGAKKDNLGRETQLEKYNKTQSALKAFLAHQDIKNICSSTVEYFPLAEFD